MGVGMGAPPPMPGLPPPPTGAGGIPTGDPGNSAKGAADNAILSLRELAGFYPSLKSMIDTGIDAIKAVAKPAATGGPSAGGPTPSPLGASTPPGAAPPDVPPPDLSGSDQQ
jgi:hypothetical protein